MSTQLYFNPFIPAFSNLGVPLPASQLHFFVSGTLTRADIFSDETMQVPLPNPVIADMAGKYPDIYLDESIVYRVMQLDSNGNSIGDDIDPYIPGFAGVGAPGPANNTYTSIEDLAASPVSNVSATLVLDGRRTDYFHVTTDESDNPLAIASDISGYWFPQSSEGISFNQSGAGAAIKTTEQKLREFRTAADFGAVGDAVLSADRTTLTGTDDTDAIQAAIDALPSGSFLDGLGKTYRVKILFLKSEMSLINFNFIADGNGNTDWSVVQIGNDLLTEDGYLNSPAGVASYAASANAAIGIRNILIDNVHIHGNRHNQTNVETETEPNAARDGGKHGFSLKGNVSNVTIRNSSAIYCGTDGLQIYRGLGLALFTDNDFAFRNIRVENCDFSFNRRHGGSGDSIDGFLSRNCTYNDNGQPIDGGLTIGDTGELLDGLEYGNGFDMEGYGIGSNVRNVRFEGGSALRNARSGLLFLEPVDQDDPAFEVRSKIEIIDFDMDSGTRNITGEFCLTITSALANEAKVAAYNDIYISGGCHKGAYLFRSVDGFRIVGVDQQVPAISSIDATPWVYGIFLINAINGKWRNSTTNNHTIFLALSSNISKDDLVVYASAPWSPGSFAAGQLKTITLPMPGVTALDAQWKVEGVFGGLYGPANAYLVPNCYASFPSGNAQMSLINTKQEKRNDAGDTIIDDGVVVADDGYTVTLRATKNIAP